MTVAVTALLCGSIFFSAPSASAEESASELAPVDVVAVSGLIDDVVAHEIEQALDRSSVNGAQAVILQLNSYGAVVSRQRMTRLLEHIVATNIPVAVWIGPSGARAYGLSAQLVAVADVSAMAPGTRIGYSGTPLVVDGVEVSLGEANVRLRTSSVGFTDARRLGVLKFSGSDTGVPVVRNMINVLDGLSINGRILKTTVETLDGNGQVVRETTTARFFKLGVLSQLMHTVASPPVAYLLFAIGLALLVFEFFTAGIGIAGLVGAICTVLGCYGLAALPVRGWSMAVLILAVVALAVDAQVGVPRLWTAIGLAMFVISSFTLYRPIDGTDMRLSWLTLISGITMMSLAFIVGMPSIVRTRFATPTIGREWMIGSQGIAVTDISPEGIVKVHDASWRARTNRATPLVAGSPLRVTGIDGVTLDVEPLEGAARDYREMRKATPSSTEPTQL
ncbi:MAG: NfeD family protein [Actinomycetota bacterium]